MVLNEVNITGFGFQYGAINWDQYCNHWLYLGWQGLSMTSLKQGNNEGRDNKS